VTKVAIQTNLACDLDWVKDCNLDILALWTTFHPTEVSIEKFLVQCQILDLHNVKYSVGIVGLKEHQTQSQLLRQQLDPNIYLWVNAYKRQLDYYTSADIDLFTQIDQLFPINNQVYNTFGKPCRTGHQVITVDGEGTMRRCHFIPDSIGNIYDPNFEESLFPRTCQNQVCRCHIGYVHLEEFNLDKVYGDGILERIPSAGSRAFLKSPTSSPSCTIESIKSKYGSIIRSRFHPYRFITPRRTPPNQATTSSLPDDFPDPTLRGN
ncbi:STM4011 family radical SAM protein, partial [Chamaesiphon sp. VAR_48_metabat_135_sub]|uniref:STM4011 family radical SAM protein n=1 Tax=Chamaesiphon sp. VAR_48_metabat_135_sub TaxID=2964699 RepID=UPI00286B6974